MMTKETDQFESGQDKNNYPSSADDIADEVLDQFDPLQASPEVGGVASLRDKLTHAEQEVLRGRAEMENFRKRMLRDADQQLKFANVPIVRDLLDVIDNLNRALESGRNDETNAKALIDGVQMVSQQFTDVLAKHGCKAIEAVGTEFDPNIHQAIAQMPSLDHASGKVAQQLALGFMLHDRVIRPAQVIVSTGSGT